MANSKRPRPVRIALADLKSRLPSELFLHLAGPQPFLGSDTGEVDFNEVRSQSEIMTSRRYQLVAPGEKPADEGWDQSLQLRASRDFKSDFDPKANPFTLGGEVHFRVVNPEDDRKIDPIPIVRLIGEKETNHLRVNNVRVGMETIPATPSRVLAAIDAIMVCKAFILASRERKTVPPDYLPKCVESLRPAFPGTAKRQARIIEMTRIDLSHDK